MKISAQTRALVTGASRGIGLATCRALAARGATLGMVSRGEEELRARAEQLGGEALVADVSDFASVSDAIDRFAQRAGGVDLLVANAGVLHYAPFAEQPVEDAEAMVRINVLGTIYTVKAALPHLLDGANGHIVVLSSGAGLRSFPWGAVYGATKAADRLFAEALRHELSGTGVSVTTVYPGEFKTGITAHQRERLPDWRKNDEELPVEPLVDAILEAVESDKRAVYLPRAVRVLGLSGIAPRLVDRLLAAIRGGSAAPRRD
jgi:short-subunit dehydrogenase